MPEGWRDRIIIVRNTSQDEATVTFFTLETDMEGNPQPFLRISALTGSSRGSKAVRGGRFTLSRQAETTFTAELLEANNEWGGGLTEDEVCAAFSLITREWDDN